MQRGTNVFDWLKNWLNSLNWRNIPNSFEEIERDSQNPMGHILNAITEITKSTPSKIRDKTDFVNALKKIEWDEGISYYDHYKAYIHENMDYEAEEQVPDDDQQPLLNAQQNKCCCDCVVL